MNTYFNKRSLELDDDSIVNDFFIKTNTSTTLPINNSSNKINTNINTNNILYNEDDKYDIYISLIIYGLIALAMIILFIGLYYVGNGCGC